MTYVYRCPEFGPDTTDTPKVLSCPHCGGIHEAEPCGAPAKVRGLGFRARAPFRPFYSIQHGKKLNSWSDYHKANKEMNLIDTGAKPPKCPLGKKRVFYPGMKAS